jgi:hypothetical protein
MTDRPTNKERAALIVGDRAGTLERHEAAEVALLADVLADPATWAEPTLGLEDAVVRAVSDAEPAATPSTRSGPPRATGVRRQAATRRRRILAAACAAAVTAIVVATLGLTGNGADPDYSAELRATALAPGAHASADLTRTDAGFRITLEARGLPALPDGEYYQAWLTSPAGIQVPVGSFSSSDGRVTLWSGASPDDFPTITVTVEAADNEQGSSGRRVLVGEVHAD